MSIANRLDESLTAVDLKLVAALHEHPAASNTELSGELGCSAAYVGQRRRKLEELGIVSAPRSSVDMDALLGGARWVLLVACRVPSKMLGAYGPKGREVGIMLNDTLENMPNYIASMDLHLGPIERLFLFELDQGSVWSRQWTMFQVKARYEVVYSSVVSSGELGPLRSIPIRNLTYDTLAGEQEGGE